MPTELTRDEQTLLKIFRSLDECGKKELLHHASKQEAMEQAASLCPAGQCRLDKAAERPEIADEPIFTE